MKSNILIAVGAGLLIVGGLGFLFEQLNSSGNLQVEIAFADSVDLEQLQVDENLLPATITNSSQRVIRLVGNNAC